MQNLKILYADDHLPINGYLEFNSENPDEIYQKLKKKYPSWDEKELTRRRNVYYNASLMIKILDPAYDLEKTNHFQKALELAGSTHFDIAIIDIGWKNDLDFPKNFDVRKEDVGWKICRAIKETDKRLDCKPTLLIAYSSRFVEVKGLSNSAIDGGALPFFKASMDATPSEIDANVSALKAVVNFLAMQLTSRPPIEEFLLKTIEDMQKMKLESFKDAQREAQNQQSIWFKTAILWGSTSFVLVVIGIISAYFWNLQVGTVTSIMGALPILVSKLYYDRIDKKETIIMDGLKEIDRQLIDILNRLQAMSTQNTHETNHPTQ